MCPKDKIEWYVRAAALQTSLHLLYFYLIYVIFKQWAS